MSYFEGILQVFSYMFSHKKHLKSPATEKQLPRLTSRWSPSGAPGGGRRKALPALRAEGTKALGVRRGGGKWISLAFSGGFLWWFNRVL